MNKTNPITEEYLKTAGYKRDMTAPAGVHRMYNETKGYRNHFSWVTFQNGCAVAAFIRVNRYNADGALCNTDVWQKEGDRLIVGDLADGIEKTGADITLR